MNTNENNAKPPTLTQRRDGSYRLLYSTKNDIAYKCHSERQWSTSEMNPAAKDFDMFGLNPLPPAVLYKALELYADFSQHPVGPLYLYWWI